MAAPECQPRFFICVKSMINLVLFVVFPEHSTCNHKHVHAQGDLFPREKSNMLAPQCSHMLKKQTDF